MENQKIKKKETITNGANSQGLLNEKTVFYSITNEIYMDLDAF
jgi:hypothetical protein